jgi:hypothetical protein
LLAQPPLNPALQIDFLTVIASHDKGKKLLIGLDSDAPGQGQRQAGARVESLSMRHIHTRPDARPLKDFHRLGVRKKPQIAPNPELQEH